MPIQPDSTYTVQCDGNQCKRTLRSTVTPDKTQTFNAHDTAQAVARMHGWYVISAYSYCPDCIIDVLNGQTICPKGRH